MEQADQPKRPGRGALMPRTNLASLLDGASTAQAPDPTSLRPAVASDGPPPAGRPQRDAHHERRGSEGADANPRGDDDRVDAGGEGGGTTALPRYLQMERKELRLRLDQADELGRLTRRLNRARAKSGERITDNTLIRVAIDLLLQRSDGLAGATEDELRKSLSP
jgi:hypothetical protein